MVHQIPSVQNEVALLALPRLDIWFGNGKAGRDLKINVGGTGAAGRDPPLPEQFQLVLIGSGQFDPMAGFQGQKILTIDV